METRQTQLTNDEIAKLNSSKATMDSFLASAMRLSRDHGVRFQYTNEAGEVMFDVEWGTTYPEIRARIEAEQNDGVY